MIRDIAAVNKEIRDNLDQLEDAREELTKHDLLVLDGLRVGIKRLVWGDAEYAEEFLKEFFA